MATSDGAEADEADGSSGADGPSRADDGPGRIGVLVRMTMALLAVAFGIVWIVRLAFVGSTLRGGLLFELLAPLVLLYFGLDYLRTQRHALGRGSRTNG